MQTWQIMVWASSVPVCLTQCSLDIFDNGIPTSPALVRMLWLISLENQRATNPHGQMLLQAAPGYSEMLFE